MSTSKIIYLAFVILTFMLVGYSVMVNAKSDLTIAQLTQTITEQQAQMMNNDELETEDECLEGTFVIVVVPNKPSTFMTNVYLCGQNLVYRGIVPNGKVINRAPDDIN